MAEESISLEKFEQLAAERERVATKSSVELLQWMAKKAVTTKAVSKFLGTSISAAYSRLTRLESKGYIVKRYQEKTAYWAPTGKQMAAEEAE